MKFEKAINERRRASDTSAGREQTSQSNTDFRQDRLLATLDLEVEISREKKLNVILSIRSSSNSNLKRFKAGPSGISAAMNELVRALKAEKYGIDKNSFTSFIKNLKAEASDRPARTAVLANDDTPPTKRNPKPKWDAEFILKTAGGTGNVVSIFDKNGKTITFVNAVEKEKRIGRF